MYEYNSPEDLSREISNLWEEVYALQSQKITAEVIEQIDEIKNRIAELQYLLDNPD